MRQALDEIAIQGIKTNIPLHQALMQEPVPFVWGEPIFTILEQKLALAADVINNLKRSWVYNKKFCKHSSGSN